MLSASSCASCCSDIPRDASLEASRVFWFCLRQLQLDRDVCCAEFHPNWQQEKQAWPTYVQQVLHVMCLAAQQPTVVTFALNPPLLCV